MVSSFVGPQAKPVRQSGHRPAICTIKMTLLYLVAVKLTKAQTITNNHPETHLSIERSTSLLVASQTTKDLSPENLIEENAQKLSTRASANLLSTEQITFEFSEGWVDCF